MYLRELRINGFKSFADPTRVDLRPGVTAIVGPNGCGKSNIADAIRWVLGEQSAKSLRAGAMQDVIFQGTTHRKPVNLCEVSLVFTECEEQLGTAFKEVEVSRRVIRDGGSEYSLNGKQCRLKDIQRLFLDTGVGQVSYSFMLQGQIDAILSTNPSERRTIFEEAAGISRYKAQRRETMNKLVGVDANLARVTDVIEEVHRQIGSLRRQASKAIRFKRLKHRLTHLDLAVGARKMLGLRQEITTLEGKSGFLRGEVHKLQRELDLAEGGLSTKRQRRLELNERLQEAQQTVYNLRSQRETAQQKAEYAVLRSTDLRSRKTEIETEIGELKERQRMLAERLAGETRSKQEQLDLFDTSDDLFKQKSQEMIAVQEKISRAETELNRARQALLMKESALTRSRSNCTTLEVDLKSFQMVHANLSEEIQLLREDALVLQRDAEELLRIHQSRILAKAEQEQRLVQAREDVAGYLTAFRELQKQIQETDRGMARVQAQIQVLEGLQQKLEGFSEGAKALLQGQLSDVIDSSEYAVFLRQIQVKEEWTAAIETILGTALEGIFIKDASKSSAIRDKLIHAQLGRACLQTDVVREGVRSLPAVSGWESARAAVSSTEPGVARLLDRLLDGCYCVNDLSAFMQHWRQHPELQFHLVATPEGELIDSRGILLVGSRKGKRESTFLARANEIKQQQRLRQQLQDQLERFRMQTDQAQQRIDLGEKRIEESRALIAELAHEVSTLQAQSANAQKAIEQNQRTLDNKERELDNLERRKEESLVRLEKAQLELRTGETDLEQQREVIAQSETTVARLNSDREALRDTFNEVRLEIAEKRQRLEILDRGLEQLTQQAREVEVLSVRRRQELDSLSEQLEALAGERETQQERAAQIEVTLRTTMESLEKDRQALLAVEKEIQVVEQGMSGHRSQYDHLSRELNQVDVNLAKQQAQAHYVAEEIQRDYQINVTAVDWRRELWLAGDPVPDRIKVEIEDDASEEDIFAIDERPEPTNANLEAMADSDWPLYESEAQGLRGRIGAMGPVNLIAIEEYKELKERHQFLKAQSDDLWSAKEQLLTAINEINATSHKLFSDTFEQIRRNFKFTFDTLFGGGTADLNLVDNEDVLESGIDIIAQPPGTRLKTLALLSGGQRTMTAVGLLFAIYMVKPSPFCVLDEIDAPLDDANIGRFCTMVEKFLEYSQFLIITHNKRTISAADTIYGVTMQEKGVSRLVSMRFNKATGQAETVAAVPVT